MLDGLRFDPSKRRGHVESWFLKINDPRGERALWVKATILSRLFGSAVAESWAIAFERGKPPFARKATVAFEDARFSRTAVDVELPTLLLSRERARGEHDGIAFDLALSDDAPPLLLYPRRMYETPFPTTKLVSPMANLVARGSVRAFGETWNVEGWRGMLGHNWGRAHTFAYAWAHCNVWDEDVDLVFEGASGRVRLGPALLPLRTTVVVRLNGETHALNHVSEILRNDASLTFRRWRFSARGPTLSVRGELFAETEDMAGLHYENPDGTMTYCLNSKLASARLALAPQGGLPIVVSSRAAALEIGTRERAHGVRMIA
ncbi:MAG TPA: tocopherol cyclase family protein [Polyangiaceae bacterium]|jgi:hypothetical protein